MSHSRSAAATTSDGEVTIDLTAFGEGMHTFALRADNLAIAEAEKTRTLRTGQAAKVQWKGRMRATDAPWIAVVIPDGELLQRRELFGAIPRFTLPRSSR